MIVLGTLLLVLLLVLTLTVGRRIDAHHLSPEDRWPALANLLVPVILLGAAAWTYLDAPPASTHEAAAIVVVGILVSAVVGNPVTGAVLALADPRSRPDPGPDPAYGAPAPPPPPPDPAAFASMNPALIPPIAPGLPISPGPPISSGSGPGASAGPGVPDGRGPADPSLLRGGAWIGTLERIMVTAGLLSGWGEVVLLIVAIKGLGRYPELRSPASAERFIIGTITSLIWAGAAAQVILLGLH